MRPATRANFMLLFAVVVVIGGGVVFRGGQALGRMMAFAEIAGFALGVLWKFVLLAVVFFWLRSAWRGEKKP
jgi:hypothetical protein